MIPKCIGRLAGVAALALLASMPFGNTPAFAAGEVLKLGAPGLPPARGNPLQGLGTPTSYTWSAMFDAMTRIDETGNVAPELAVGWKNMTPTTWHFSLRPNTKFSNGEPLNAQAIVDNILYLFTDEGKVTLTGRDLSQKLVTARTIDDLTVEIESVKPNPDVPREVMKMYVVAPKAWKDLGVEGFSAAPVGTGSYKVEDWGPEVVKFVSYDESWRKPTIERFEVLALADGASRLQALLSGQIHIAVGLSIDAIPQMKTAGVGVDVYPAPYILAWPFMSSNRQTPFSDRRVRQAANYAVDKESIVRNLLNGNGFPAGQAATRQTFGYNPDVKAYPYDPAKAKALLAEAGYPNGFKMAAEVLPGNFPADTDIYQRVAEDLGKVGIEVDLRAITFGDFLTKIVPAAPATDLGYDQDVYAFQLDFPLGVGATAASLIQRNWSCRRKLLFYCNEEEIRLLEDAETEFDDELRLKKLQKLMATFHDNAPGLFLIEIVDLVGHSASVENLKMVNRVLNYHEAVLSE